VVGVYSQRALVNSKKNSKTDIFLSLRAAYINIHGDFPRKGCEKTDLNNGVLERYWLNAYNEWYVTNIICPEHNLWDEFFKPAIMGALERDEYKEKLESMMAKKICFGDSEHKKKFLRSIGIKNS